MPATMSSNAPAPQYDEPLVCESTESSRHVDRPVENIIFSGKYTLVQTSPQEFEIDPQFSDNIDAHRHDGEAIAGNSTHIDGMSSTPSVSAAKGAAPTKKIFSRGIQLYCLAMLSGSLMKACSKVLVRHLDLFVVLFSRMVITAIVSTAVLYYLKVEHLFWGQKDIRLLLFIRGALGFFNIVCTYFALQYLSLPDQAVISFLTPLATSVAAHLFLKEQYRWQQAAASCVSLVGVVIIARPTWLFGSPHRYSTARAMHRDGSASRIATLHSLAVISSMCVVITASAVMIILRKIRDRAHALTSVANYAVVSVVASLVALIVKPLDTWRFPQTPKVWGLVVLVGLFGFMLQVLSSHAIQMEEATTLSNFKYTQLLYATTLEFLFWHDVPDTISFLGMALILGGVVWSARFKTKK